MFLIVALGRKHDFSKKSICISVIIVPIYMGTIMLSSKIHATLSHHYAIHALFGFFVLLLGSQLMSTWINVDVEKWHSIIIPTYFSMRLLSAMACIFPGCCNGLQRLGGIYSFYQNEYVFPTILIECIAVAILLFTALFIKNFRNNKYFLYFVIVYGVLMFFLDMTRDNNKLIGMSSSDVVLIYGIIIYGLIMRFGIKFRS